MTLLQNLLEQLSGSSIMINLKDEIKFPCGLSMKNRFMLAPLTNTQSHENGILSEDEFNWLTMRAKGNFGLTMSCASHVQSIGKGFPGQLGIFGDEHIEGLKRLTDKIKSYESLAVAQLHHAGMKSPKDIIGEQPVCPSDDNKTNSRALKLDEVKRLRDNFIEAGVRAKNISELDDTINEMISIDRPVIADIWVDKKENCFPMIPSGAAHHEMLLSKYDKENPENQEKGKVLV